MSFIDIRSTNLSRTWQVGKPLVQSRGGIVTAQNRQAAAIGARVLRDGGSAVDAAIATSLAVGVLEPWMSGIGGVAAMLVRTPDGAVTSIDAGAQSPAGLAPADFPLLEGRDEDLFGWPRVLDDRNVTGARAVCVPALLAGLAAAHERFGRRPWRELVMPAVALARRGLMVDFHTTGWIANDMARLMRDGACRDWLLPDGYPPATPAAAQAQARYLPAPHLADTLLRIANEGASAFYRGPVADALARDVQAAGGYLTAGDLAGSRPIVGPAATQAYRGYTLHVGPQLNGGITVAMAMRASEQSYQPGDAGSNADADADVDADARLAAAMPAYCDALLDAWAYRLSRLGDGAERALPTCTSHLNVVDRDGAMVTLTQTLLSSFGACLLSPSTGVLLNNGVNWFDPVPGRPNSIGADRRALSNYAPALFTSGDDVVGIGGSGGRKIIPAVYQALAQIADHGVALDAAIAGPRVDVSAPPVVVADARLPAALLRALSERHQIVLAGRTESPNHFCILGGVRRRDGVNQGHTEPFHPWADAVAEDDPDLDHAVRGL